MSSAETERTKLTATAISNVGLAFAVAGFVAPLAALSFSSASAPAASAATITVSLVWLAAAIALHVAARWTLGRLGP